MKKYIVDTNCLLAYFTDRIAEQTEKISIFIEEASNLSVELYITPIVITEVVYTLESVYEVKPAEIRDMVEALIGTPGIIHHEIHPVDVLLELWPERIKDYGDAVIAGCGRILDVPVLTFDRHFSKQMSANNIANILLK